MRSYCFLFVASYVEIQKLGSIFALKEITSTKSWSHKITSIVSNICVPSQSCTLYVIELLYL